MRNTSDNANRSFSRREFIGGAFSLAALLGLAGCGASAPKQETAATTAAATTAAAGSSDLILSADDLPHIGGKTTYPFTYTTYNYAQQQVEVTIEKAPEKVFCCQQNNIETMLKLGLKDKIVLAYGLDDENALGDLKADFDQIPFQDGQPSKEDIIGKDPDFITAWYSTFADDFAGDVDFWHDRGCGTYMSRNSACRGKEAIQTIYDEFMDILLLGQVFDVQDKAQAVVDEMLDEVKKVQEYAAKQEKRPQVAVIENQEDSFRVYAEYTLGGNVATEAGADLKLGKGQMRATISAEDLIAANPDDLFMVWYEGFRDANSCVADIMDNPKFASMDCVKNKRVFPIALTGIYCSGLHTIDGLRAVYTALYPDLK